MLNGAYTSLRWPLVADLFGTWGSGGSNDQEADARKAICTAAAAGTAFARAPVCAAGWTAGGASLEAAAEFRRVSLAGDL